MRLTIKPIDFMKGVKKTIIICSHENANTKRKNVLGLHLDSELSFGYQRFTKKKVVKFVCWPE